MDKCPYCGDLKKKILQDYQNVFFSKVSYTIFSCLECGHLYSQFEDSHNYGKLYASGQYQVMDTRQSIVDRIVNINNRLIINSIKSLNPDLKHLLDFGCGKGQFLNYAENKGFIVSGIETSKERADFAKNIYNLDVRSKYYTGGLLDNGPFDIITMLHVAEHLETPFKVISDLVNQNLKNKGLLVVEVPMFDSWQSQIAGNQWLHLDPPYHNSHFTGKNLISFLKNSGLNILKAEYFSTHLGVLGMVQSIMGKFGYKKMIISELKLNRNITLLLKVLLTLPFAIILEMLAVLFNKGGVIRVYCEKSKI